MREERDIGGRRRWLAVLLVAALAGAVIVAIQMRGSDFRWAAFIDGLRRTDSVFLGAAILAIMLTYLGRALRWRVMLRPLRPSPSLKTILSSTVVGFTAVVFFGRPGELVRPWLIARREKVSLSSQLAAWFLERVLDLLMVLILFGFALMQTRDGMSVGPRMRTLLSSSGALVLLLGIGCVILLIASAFYANSSRIWFERFATVVFPHRIRDRIVSSYGAFVDGLASTGSASNLGELFVWTVLEWATIVAGMHFILLAYPATAGFRVQDTVLFAGFVAFGSVVQLPGIGGGFQVAAILVLTELFGLSLESATALALLAWGVSWLTVVPFGVAVAFAEGLHWRSLRHVESEDGIR